MNLKLYNTLTRPSEPQAFRPIDPANVRMYVCGPTVYDFAHIGNARPVIVFDLLFRLLRHLYGAEHVTYVRNITDVDDKINARAAREHPTLPLNDSIREITKKTEQQFHDDVEALGCLRPTVEPRATAHIGEMVNLIERLIENNRAYVLDDHVLFRVKGLKSYGQLSHRSLDEMKTSARGEMAPKKDSMDFVLWKPSKDGEPGWPSPNGIGVLGRPGWHIECSAMSWKYLGERFDIHGGGVDLLFPHHENERAQSCRAFNRLKMANVWMHNAFLQVEGQKMSKSVGNFVTIRELLRGWNGRAWSGSAIRLAMLETHYRRSLDWTQTKLSAARNEIWEFALACAQHSFSDNTASQQAWSEEAKPTADLVEALCDDLNTSDALTILRNRLRALSKTSDVARREFVHNLRFLGLFKSDRFYAYQTGAAYIVPASMPSQTKERVATLAANLQAYLANDDFEMIEGVKNEALNYGLCVRKIQGGALNGSLQIEPSEETQVSIQEMIAARNAARKAKNFAEADRIRDELKAMGLILKDHPDGTTTTEPAR